MLVPIVFTFLAPCGTKRSPYHALCRSCMLAAIIATSITGVGAHEYRDHSSDCVAPLSFWPTGKTRFTIVAPSNATCSSAMNGVGVFNAFAGDDAHSASRLTVGPDSFSDVTLVAPNKVDPSWQQLHVPPIPYAGIGGLAPQDLTTAVRIPIRMQWGSPLAYICA